MAKTFAVLVNNGFSYEYRTAIVADSVAKARAEWIRMHGGKQYDAADFRVRAEKPADITNWKWCE